MVGKKRRINYSIDEFSTDKKIEMLHWNFLLKLSDE